MDTLIKADIFFFITSIAVILVSIGILVALYYIVKAVDSFEKFSEKIEENMMDASEEVKEMAEDIRNSFLFSFLFGKKRRRNNDRRKSS